MRNYTDITFFLGGYLFFLVQPQNCYLALGHFSKQLFKSNTSVFVSGRRHGTEMWSRISSILYPTAICHICNFHKPVTYDRQNLCQNMSYLLEKGTSEFTAILLLLLSIDTTPPPRFPALPFTLMRSWRNCSCRCRGHSKSGSWP